MNLRRKLLDVTAPKEVKIMLKFLDGKKSILGVLIVVAPQVIDAIGQVLSVAGGDTEAYTKIAGGLLAILGIVHKFLQG